MYNIESTFRFVMILDVTITLFSKKLTIYYNTEENFMHEIHMFHTLKLYLLLDLVNNSQQFVYSSQQF